MFFKKSKGAPIDAQIDLEDMDSCSYWKREHYIPIRKAELIDRLAAELSGSDRERFLELCKLIDATLSLEFNSVLDQLKSAYASANPDSDTRTLASKTDESTTNLAGELFSTFESVLKRANFQKLSVEQIKEAIGTASDFGVRLKLDLDAFDRLDVYARGDVVHHRTRDGKLSRKLSSTIDVPIYKRLVAIFQPNERLSIDGCESSDMIYLKLMKNVPHEDVNMMLPGGKVQMSILDGGKVILPTLSGLCIAISKILKGAVILAFAKLYQVVGLVLFAIGTLSYGWKSFSGYKRIKENYEHNVTKSMYFRSLDNNAGVLHRLVDEAHEQEFRETILGYFVLWQDASGYDWTAGQVDRKAEEKLRSMTNIDIDFEVEDAIAKLERFGLVIKSDNGTWRAERIHRAISGVDGQLHAMLP